MEAEKYRNGWGFAVDNISSGVMGLVAGFAVGVGTKYLGFKQTNPMVYAAAMTPLTDVVDKMFVRNWKVSKLVRDDPGMFVGQTLGYTFAALL